MDADTEADTGRERAPATALLVFMSAAALGRRAVLALTADAPSKGVPYVEGLSRPLPRPRGLDSPPMRGDTGVRVGLTGLRGSE